MSVNRVSGVRVSNEKSIKGTDGRWTAETLSTHDPLVFVFFIIVTL